MRSRYKEYPETETLTVRMPVSDKKTLFQAANESGNSVGQLVRSAINQHLIQGNKSNLQEKLARAES